MEKIVSDSSKHYYFYEGTRLYLCEKKFSPTLIFVSLILTIIFLFNGLYWLINGYFSGFILTTIGLVSGYFYWDNRKKSKKFTHQHHNIVLIVDTNEQKFYSNEDKLLGTFQDSRLGYTFMATSSAKKLTLTTKSGERVIAEGNPFSGTNKPFHRILAHHQLIY